MEIVAFTADHVRRLTGLSLRQIRYWDATGFFSPTLVPGNGDRIFSRVYSFRDVVGLRTIALLRSRIPLQQLRRVGEWLRARSDAPWSSLRFAISGRQVAYFENEVQAFVEAQGAGQLPVVETLQPIADDMSAAAMRLRERQPNDLGQIARNRYVVHNAWTVAGTRIPVAAIQSLSAAGYSSVDIVREYPRLTPQDVTAALKHARRAA